MDYSTFVSLNQVDTLVKGTYHNFRSLNAELSHLFKASVELCLEPRVVVSAETLTDLFSQPLPQLHIGWDDTYPIASDPYDVVNDNRFRLVFLMGFVNDLADTLDDVR